MSQIEVLLFANFTKSAAESAERFCWRGYRVLTFCPLCLREVLTVEETCVLTKAFSSPQNSKLVEAFTDAHDIGLLVLVPSKRETAQLLNYRLILAPVCSHHHSQIDALEIERRILQASRYGEIVKERFL